MNIHQFNVVVLSLALASGCDKPARTGQRLFDARFNSKKDVAVVPWRTPARNGFNMLTLEGPGQVHIEFEHGEKIDATADAMCFLQQQGCMDELTVIYPRTDEQGAYASLDRLTTEWNIDKAGLGRWHSVCKDKFLIPTFGLSREDEDHYVTIEVTQSFFDDSPYVVELTYGWWHDRLTNRGGKAASQPKSKAGLIMSNGAERE